MTDERDGAQAVDGGAGDTVDTSQSRLCNVEGHGFGPHPACPHTLVERADWVNTEPATSDDGAKEKKPSQATLLVKIAREQYRLVTGDDGRPYAVAKRGASIARPLRGANGLRKFLARAYADACRGVAPSQSALADAMAVLDGYAADAEPEPVYLRTAPYRNGVVIDLGTVDGRCVQVDRHGWIILERAPVLFRRTNLTAPMPTPIRGGLLDPLLELLNAEDRYRKVLVGWMLAAFLPEIPHAILAIFGEQGTAKSTATKLCMQLVDPSTAPLRSPPRDIRQWAVTANASWTVAVDNVSDVPQWWSDLLCKAVTGDGHVDRALYSDDDVAVLKFRRVLAINGISIGSLKGDLADRFLPLELHVIDGAHRRSDEEVHKAIAEAYPAALGALLDLLVEVLKVLPTVRLESMPRMADFARVLAALDQVKGWQTLETYLGSAGDLAGSVVDSDPFATALRDFIDGKTTWTGSMTDLFEAMPTPDPRPRTWPKTTQGVRSSFSRCAPALRQLGYTITPGELDPKTRRQTWELTAPPSDDAEGDDDARREAPNHGSDPSHPSNPQVTAPKDPGGDPSDLFAAVEAAKDPQGNHSRSFTATDQGKHVGREGSKDPKDDSQLLSGPTCLVCHGPIRPVAGSTVHPNCEGDAA